MTSKTKYKDTNPSALSKWGTLYDAYLKSNRFHILKKICWDDGIKNGLPIYLAAAAYIVLSISTFLCTNYFGLSLLASIMYIGILYTWTEHIIAKNFHVKYMENNLKSHPYFARSKILSYILFSDHINNNGTINTNEVDDLIAWQKSQGDQPSPFDFFKSTWAITILSFASSFVFEFTKLENLTQGKNAIFVIFFIMILLWLGWTISDAKSIHKRKNIEICRYIDRWKIDQSIST